MAQRGGGVFLTKFSNFCLVIYPWGVTICFQVILAKFIVQLLNDVFGLDLFEDRDAEVYNNNGNLSRIMINLAAILLAIPLIMKRDIGVLQKLGLVAVTAVVFNIIAILITTFTGFSRTI